MYFKELITSVQQFTIHRLEHYFGQRNDAPLTSDFNIKKHKKGPFNQFAVTRELSKDEQLLLAITLVPHLNPELYTNIIHYFLPQGGDLPIFGAAKAKYHRGIIPTGETAQFIIAGTEVKDRLRIAELLKISTLITEGVLVLEAVPAGEPEMSGRLSMTKEYLSLFLTGEQTIPSFGPDFPAQKIETQRNWEDLILEDGVQEQIQELQVWMQHNDQLFKDWDMYKKLNPGYRVLFYGPSGTGKTLTATMLGKYTGRAVFRVDLSTIVSKYIGETEKNLEKLFSKAANKDWILFFDEADALFGKRTEVNDSHDRYANQEVSYLLQRVENFGGLVILSTNYKSNIDDAFLRRFNAIIKFPFPDGKLRKRIWETSLPEKAKLEKKLNLTEIANRYKLTGGSIINVIHQASLKAISEDTQTITLESVLHGIKREVEKEGKVFEGFTDQKITTNGRH